MEDTVQNWSDIPFDSLLGSSNWLSVDSKIERLCNEIIFLLSKELEVGLSGTISVQLLYSCQLIALLTSKNSQIGRFQKKIQDRFSIIDTDHPVKMSKPRSFHNGNRCPFQGTFFLYFKAYMYILAMFGDSGCNRTDVLIERLESSDGEDDVKRSDASMSHDDMILSDRLFPSECNKSLFDCLSTTQREHYRESPLLSRLLSRILSSEEKCDPVDLTAAQFTHLPMVNESDKISLWKENSSHCIPKFTMHSGSIWKAISDDLSAARSPSMEEFWLSSKMDPVYIP